MSECAVTSDPEEFVRVILRRAVERSGVTIPVGAVGIVVHRHADGRGYEVEFAEPFEIVVTLTSDEFERSDAPSA